MRAFIASPAFIDDYDNLKKSFSDIVQGKWVEEQMLHLTWVFLGNLHSIDSIEDKMDRMDNLLSTSKLVSLSVFGKPPRVLYATVPRNGNIENQARIFDKSGFDMSRFKPHVTLCRIKNINGDDKFKSTLDKFRYELSGKISTEIILYESKLTPSGPIYSELKRIHSINSG